MTKSVIIESVRGIASIQLDDVLLRDRCIFLCEEVTTDSCNELIKELLYLESTDNESPINLFINSRSGCI